MDEHSIIAMTRALDVLRARQDRTEHPDGTWDKAGRWYPSEHELAECCRKIAGPTRAYPYTFMVHCRSALHVAARSGVSASDLRSADTALKMLAKGQAGPSVMRWVLALGPDVVGDDVYRSAAEHARRGRSVGRPPRPYLKAVRRAIRAAEAGRRYRSRMGLRLMRDVGPWVMRDGSDHSEPIALRDEHAWLVVRRSGVLPAILSRLMEAELLRLGLPCLVADPPRGVTCLSAPERWMSLPRVAIHCATTGLLMWLLQHPDRRVRLLAIKQLDALKAAPAPLADYRREAAA